MATIYYKKKFVNLNVVLTKFMYVIEEVGEIATPRECVKYCGNTTYFWTKCLNELIKLGKIKKGFRKTYYCLNYKKLTDDDYNFENAFWHGYKFGTNNKFK